jgi:voltage-gated potassium channel
VQRGLIGLILVSVTAAVFDTMPGIRPGWDLCLRVIEITCVGVFTVEYAARVWIAADDRTGRYDQPFWGRLRYMATPMAIVDLLAILPTYLAVLVPGDFMILRMLRILRILKITRYSPALATFEIVLVNERRSLTAAGTILGVALLLAASALHHIEGDVQPAAFGSIPAAMWWAIVTLTTVGYGDVVPITPLGRIVGGLCAVIGLGMFALPTAILGAGFAHEIQKRNFAATAAMISRVPLFQHLRPPQLAELTTLLRPRTLPPRYTVIRRGEHPESMFFIDEGRVAIRHRDRRITLSAGSFFGEMALLEGRPRQVSVITLTTCRLLELQAGDFHRLLAGDARLRQTITEEVERRTEAAPAPLSREEP